MEGLRSGDVYYAKDGKAIYYNSILRREFAISAGEVSRLEESTGYIRLGYSGAEIQLRRLYPLLVQAKDIRGIENTGIELCEIAKNAADFLVEARGYSDFYNTLSFPILKASGGAMVNLDGVAFEDLPVDPTANVDFIACSNGQLLDRILKELNEFWSTGQYLSSGTEFLVTNR